MSTTLPQLLPLDPAPSMELSQFRKGERAVSVMACENYAKLYAQAYGIAVWKAAMEAAAPAWQPIDTAPKDGRHVLIANDAPGSIHPREAYYVSPDYRYENEPKHAGWWRLAGSCEERVHGRTPTHWMALPAPPAICSLPLPEQGGPQ